jgi:hypothetical protein
MKLRQLSFLVASFAIGLPTMSEAGVIFTLGNNPQPGEENILLNQGTSGTTIFGTTNQSGTIVQFTSTQTLTEPSNGQARVEATNGSSQIALTNVTISVPNGTFGDLIFNPSITGQIGTGGGTANVTAVANDGTYNFSYSIGNGNNFLTLTTDSGTRMNSVEISYSTGFTDLRQIRISELGGAVPEPASMTIMAIGAMFVTTLGVRRSRRQAK